MGREAAADGGIEADPLRGADAADGRRWRSVIRKASPDDRAAVVTSVVAAFAGDPAWEFLLGNEYERLAGEFAGALFDLRVAGETVWVSEDLAAVAMWDPPDQGDAVPGYAAGVWGRYRASAGEEAFERLARYNDALDGVAPAEPGYWYLGVLATHPDRQREGLASAVLAPILDEADRLGLTCCLETSTAGNRRFYERRGFTEATDVVVAGGPPTWWLRRSPGISGYAR
jgi:GNAT superfamily N-acetyltransferase